MQTILKNLAADQHWRLPATAGLRIACLHGIVWVTVAGDSRDHFLLPGQSLLLTGRQAAVAGALEGPAQCAVHLPAAAAPPPAYFRRWREAWRQPLS